MMIRKWLQRNDAKTVRCLTPTGEKTIVVHPTNPKRWADAERAIHTLEATRIEALDAAGTVVAAVALEVEGAAEEEVPADDKMAQLTQLAKIISDAHDKGALRAKESLIEGHQALIQIVAILTERTAQLEKAWTSTLNYMAKNAMANMGDESDATEATMKAMMELAMVKLAQHQNGAKNGKAKEEPKT